MGKLETVAYLSAASRELTGEEIDALLADAREFNNANGISEVLFFDGKRFFQVFEGEPDSGHKVFERIRAAKSHDELEVLLEEEIEERNFSEWHMGCIAPPTSVIQELAQADWQAAMPVTRPSLRKSKGLSLALYYWSKWSAEQAGNRRG